MNDEIDIRVGDVSSFKFRVLWPYLLLGLLLVIFFWDSLFAHQTQCLRHPFCDLRSLPHFFQRTMPTGEMIPLWNPFNGYGAPFFAQPFAAFFYPLNWVYLLFPLGLAYTVFCMLHLWIAGVGIFALCRHWKLDVGPALMAAVSFMFSTWMVAMLEHLVLISTVVWGPLDLLMMSCLLARSGDSKLGVRTILQFAWRNLGWVVAFGLLITVQVLAGYPQMLLYNLLLAFGLVVGRSVWVRNPAMFCKGLVALMLVGLVTFCLCLPQLLLSWELTQLSERAQGTDPGLAMASMNPRHLITLLLPFVYGRPGYPEEYWAETIYEFWAGTCYVGVLPLVLATCSILWARSDPSRGENSKRFLFFYFVAVALFGLVMAAGSYTPIYMFFNRHVPGFSYFRWPSKFLLLLLYSLSILSGLGLQALLNRPGEGRQASRLRAVLKCGWLAMLILFVAGFFLPRNGAEFFRWLTHGRFVFSPAHYRDVLNDYLVGAAFLGIVVLGLLLFLGRRIPMRWGASLAIGLAFLNLFVVSRQINFRTNDDILKTVPELVTRNLCQEQPYQFYSPYNHQWLYGSRDRSAFIWAKNVGLHSTLEPYRIFHVYQDGMKLERWIGLYSMLNTLPAREREKLADFMNIRYVVGGERIENILWGNASKNPQFFERTNCLPSVYLVSDWEVISDPSLIFPRLLAESFDIRQRAVIEPLPSVEAPRPAKDGTNEEKEAKATVLSIRHTWNRVELDVEATKRSLLVLIEGWYPGWQALIDGHPQPIFRANYHFRAVLLEPGRHQVVFAYQPWQFRFGMQVSLMSMVILAALLWLRFRRRLKATS